MAKYTIAIMGKLQEAAGDGSLLDPATLLQASKQSLFGSELEVIKEEYRDAFALGFATHFFNEEIGLETWPLWRMALIAKMYSNGDFINQTFEQLDNQVFSKYKIHMATTDKSSSNTLNVINGLTSKTTNAHEDTDKRSHANAGTTDITDTIEKNLAGTSETTTDDTVDFTANHSVNDVKVTDGTIAETDNSSSTTTKTGEETDTETIDKTLTKSGTDTTQNSGKDNVTEISEGTSSNTNVTDSTSSTNGEENSNGTNSGTQKNTSVENATNESNVNGSNTGTQSTQSNGTNNVTSNATDTISATQKYSDTPQNGLAALEDGVYLTNAQVNDQTNKHNGTDNTTTSDESIRTDNLANSSHSEGSNETTINSTRIDDLKNTNHVTNNSSTDVDSTITDNGTTSSKSQKETNHGLTSTETLDLSDKENGSVTNTIVKDLEDRTVNSGTKSTDNDTTVTDNMNVEKVDKTVTNGNKSTDTTETGTITDVNNKEFKENGTENRQLNGGFETDVTSNGNKNSTGSRNGHIALDESNYEWNYKMFMSAETVLNRVWRVFDDLFFLMM